jgi:DHA1 family bicyclomycin/chloramphenicol resistance-like MFS transporter
MAPADSFTRARRTGLIALFGLLTVFTPIGIDLYLPALPTMAHDFGTPIATIEHSLATFFLGLAVGQAVVGPVSDRFGRRMPIMVGLALYAVSSMGCALAKGPLTLDAIRFLQACGGCAGTVLARACVRDLFRPEEASRIFAQMLLILSVSPLFAPFVGGWMLLFTSWRSLFWLQAAVALPTLALVWWQLPESHPGSNRRLNPLYVMKDYWAICRDRHFYGYTVPAVLSGAGLYVFLTGWPHVVIDVYAIPPQYFGFTFVLNGVGLVFFSQATAGWLVNHSGQPLLLAALAANGVIGVLGLVFGMTGWGGILGLIPWIFLYFSLMGSINPTSAGLTMAHFGQAAGMASALIGIFMYAGGALASMAMGSLSAPNAILMTALMAGFGISGIITYLLFRPAEAR